MIRVREYPQRMHWFKVHFDLLHQALNHFSRDKEAMKTFVAAQEKKYSDGLDSYIKTEGDRPRDILDDMFVKAYRNNLGRQVQVHVEFAENKLHQTEIMLRCAFFEAEMKDIHRHCLCAKPTLLRGEKEIALGRLIADGEDAVLKKEIEAEVERIDRQSTKERAKYFINNLRLKWGDPKLFQQFYRLKSSEDHEDVVLQIEKYSDLRNKIVHKDTDYVVKQDELSEARNYFTFVPSFCCQQAVKLYPTDFSEK
jgi:hypothetical protein